MSSVSRFEYDAGYRFKEDWFSQHIPAWTRWLDKLKPQRILEIGSFEGRSTCFLIEHCTRLGDVELTCVDTWEGGIEHGDSHLADMTEVEANFNHNVRFAIEKVERNALVKKYKKSSHEALPQLLADGKREHFDLIYIDGSHQAPDVLVDAVLSFQLLRKFGIVVFDDYTWFTGDVADRDILMMPKPAIDAFTNIFSRKLALISGPNAQLCAQKVAL